MLDNPEIQERLAENTESVQNLLTHFADQLRLFSKMTMKENGNTAEDSQLMALLNAVDKVEHIINGIEPTDLRVPDIKLVSEDEREKFPENKLVVDLNEMFSEAEMQADSFIKGELSLLHENFYNIGEISSELGEDEPNGSPQF